MRLVTFFATLICTSALFAAEEPLSPEAYLADPETYRSKESVVLEMLVQSTGGRRNCYLNSEKTFTSPANFTISIPYEARKKFERAGITNPQAHYKKKTIRVTGKIELARGDEQLETSGAGSPRITVSSPSQIKIVK